MEQKKILQQELKKDLELLTKQPLTDSESWQAYFNLSGFFKTLDKMRKEANFHDNISN